MLCSAIPIITQLRLYVCTVRMNAAQMGYSLGEPDKYQIREVWSSGQAKS